MQAHCRISDRTFNFNKLINGYICLYCIYISFETIILNFSPSGTLFYVRFVPEIIGYLFLLIVVLTKRISITKHDKSIFLFVIVGTISLFVNFVDIKIGILGFRWILRYVVIYWIICWNKWSKKELSRLVSLISIISLAEVILSAYQIIDRSGSNEILLPHYKMILDGINTYSLQGESNFALFASFGRYGEFGYFVIIALWYWISEFVISKPKHNKIPISNILIWVVILMLSYSRQSLVAMVCSIYLFWAWCNKSPKQNKFLITFSGGAIASIILLVYLMSDLRYMGTGTISEGLQQRFLSIFSGGFIKADYMGKGRTWFWSVALPRLLLSKPLLGHGIGMYGCQTAITYDPQVYQLLNIPTQFSMDTYLVSIIGQVGIVGFVLLARVYIIPLLKSKAIILKTNKQSDENPLLRKVAVMTFGITVAGMVMTLFGSSLSDRYFAFYLWMFFGIQRQLHNQERSAS